MGGCTLLILTGTATAGGVVSFDIAGQGLAGALNEFARQGDCELLFATEIVAERRTAGVSGNYEPSQALQLLLESTGLTFRVTEDGAFVIDPISAEPPRSFLNRVRHSLGLYFQSAVSLFALAAGPTPALGQDTEHLALDEVIVTAQKREESLKNVPISITAFSKDELDSLRVQGVEDYISFVPNATYVKINNFASDVTLRGISVAAGGLYDPIGVTIDEAGFGTTNTSVILAARFLDIERVEVLRGPQGTLTGRNSMGGSLNIISVKPRMDSTDFEATLDVSRFDTVLAKGSLNLPLSETFALRASAYTETSEGAVRNIGPSGGTSDYDNHGGRVAARWQPSSRLTLDASIGLEKQRFGRENQIPRDVYWDADERDAQIAALEELGGVYSDTQFFDSSGTNGGVVRLDVPTGVEIEDWIASFRANYNLDSHSIDFIYGHFDYDGGRLQDGDGSEFAIYRWYNTRHDRADSYELRASSRYESSLNWVAGVSYLKEQLFADGYDDYGDSQVGGSYEREYDWWDTDIMKSLGVFANVFWDITPRLHLSAGGRMNRDETGFDAYFAGADFEEITPRRTVTLERFTPRVTLNYDLTEAVTVYGQYATGYRAGYGNTLPAVLNVGAPAEVDPEKLENFEVGAKGSFLGGRATAAVALFYMDWTDLQAYSEIEDEEGQFYGFDVNASQATAQGFEAELAFKASQFLELRANVGYVDSEIKELEFYEMSNVPVPRSRPWTASLTGLYSRPVGENWRGDVRLDYSFLDKTVDWIDGSPMWELPQHELLNVSVGLSSGRWSVTAYAENLLDEVYWVGAGSSDSLRGPYVNFIPRTYGLRVTFRSQ